MNKKQFTRKKKPLNLIAIIAISLITVLLYFLLQLILKKPTGGLTQILGATGIMIALSLIGQNIFSKGNNILLAAGLTPVIYNLIVSPAAYLAIMPMALLDSSIYVIIAAFAMAAWTALVLILLFKLIGKGR
jgi:hypothetical protein